MWASCWEGKGVAQFYRDLCGVDKEVDQIISQNKLINPKNIKEVQPLATVPRGLPPITLHPTNLPTNPTLPLQLQLIQVPKANHRPVQIHWQTDQIQHNVQKNIQGMFLVDCLSVCLKSKRPPIKRHRQWVLDWRDRDDIRCDGQ